MTDSTDRIGQLEDREAIRDLANRYAHHVWQEEPLKAVELFARDGEMDMGEGTVIKGRDALRAVYSDKVGGEMMLHPFVHNHVIDLDGDRATGTCYLDLRCTRDGQSLMGSGYYDDVYVREEGTWRFQSRKLTICYLVPPTAGWTQEGEGL